jgi:membrane protein
MIKNNMKSKIRNRISFYGEVFKNSLIRFDSEDAFTQSAGLAYYMVFSLPPMLLIIFWSAGILYDEGIVREAIFEEFGKLIGENGSDQLMHTIEGLTANRPSWWETVLGTGALFFMISTVYVTIQHALNNIFEIKINRSLSQSFFIMLRDRFLSIAMLGIIAFILTLSMVISAFFNAFVEVIEKWIGGSSIWLMLFDYIAFNFMVLTILFTLMFRYMPSKRLKWRESWYGAIFTSILFIAGKSLIGIFIGNSQAANFYDAAGSIMVLMLEVYYTSAIFLFGAIFTHTRTKLLNKYGL